MVFVWRSLVSGAPWKSMVARNESKNAANFLIWSACFLFLFLKIWRDMVRIIVFQWFLNLPRLVFLSGFWADQLNLMNLFLCRLFEVSANQCKKIGRRLVTGWKAPVQCLKMSPADCALNVLSGLSKLEKSPQRLAVHGISGFKFTNGEFCLSHETDSVLSLTTYVFVGQHFSGSVPTHGFVHRAS